MSTVPYQDALTKLRQLFTSGKVREGLRYLNSLTPHRFTGLYLFDDPTAQNKYIVDKENPDVESLPDVPTTATYCAFTRSKGDTLTIEDAQRDERVGDHPARDEIRSYCGVPLLDKRGSIYGTVCHFDYGVVRISDTNVELLEAVAPLLDERYVKQNAKT